MKAQNKNRILFLGLTTFSKTGGVEKFNKCFLKALSEIENEWDITSQSFSLYDSTANEKYFLNKNYKGFSGNHILFILKSVWKAKRFDQIFVGHINMAIVGALIKFLFPRKRVIVVAHGYEVWYPLKGFKKILLQKADLILAVSSFTKNKIVTVQHVDEKKVGLFYNTIDPYFSIPSVFNTNVSLRKRYGVADNAFVIFTLARLAFTEGYKGYDIVIKCLPALLKAIPNLKYIIAGKYDAAEKERLDAIIKELHLENVVVFTGYLDEEEVKDHYQMGDIFIMPSLGEGFGIVFIEAMACGLPVIAGNLDGSVDALKGGELGVLVNPHSTEEIIKRIEEHYQNKTQWTNEHKHQLQQKTLDYFGFEKYKERLEGYILQAQ